MITIESLKEIIENSFKETPSEDNSSEVPSPKLTDHIQEIFTQALELERKLAALHEREIGWMQEIRNMQKELDSPVIYQLTYDRFWGMRGSQGVFALHIERFINYYFTFEPTIQQINSFLYVRHDNYRQEAYTLTKINPLKGIDPQEYIPFER